MNGCYKSLDGNKHAQIFANESFFATAYPMEHKSSAGQALKQFISDFGIPDKLVCDGAAEQVGKQTEFQSTVRKHAINLPSPTIIINPRWRASFGKSESDGSTSY